MNRNWIEIVGVVSVVVSLIFVGLELSQNTEAVQATNHFSLLEYNLSLGETIYQNPELSSVDELMREGNEADFDENQKRAAGYIRSHVFNIWEAAYYSHNSGQLNDELWVAWDSSNHSFAISSYTREWWADRRFQYGRAFQEYIDNLFQQE